MKTTFVACGMTHLGETRGELAFMAEGGAMGGLLRRHAWKKSTLGAPESWPQSLKTLVGLMLGSTQPMFIIWGPERVWLHNDAMIPLMGMKHPGALGRHALDEVWSEAREALAPLFANVFAGTPVQMDDITLQLDRRGVPEEAHFAFSYTPVRDDSGGVVGLFGACTDTTATALAERTRGRLEQSETRLRFLDALAAETQKLQDADAILAKTTELVGRHMGVAVCAYADMDHDGDGFSIRGDWAAPGSQSIVGHYSLAAFGKMAVKNLNAGLPLVINDNARELPAEEAATFQSIGIAATICMPLVKAGRLTALMAIHDKTPRVWTEGELSLIREITERSWAHIARVGAEQDLRESERRYRALFDAIDEGFCVIEFIDGPHGPLSDYVHVEANAAYAVHAGIPNVVGQKVREMVGAEADAWVELYAKVLRTGEPIRFERELEATGRWLELAAFRVEPASRNQVAVLFQDLTARRLAERAVRASEENFRTLTRAMPNQAWTAQPNGMLDWFNDRVYEYGDAAQGSLDGADWTRMVHTDDLPHAIERWTAAIASGETYETEFRLQRADGAYRWHLARAVAIKNTAGKVIRWIGTNTDIHDQKTASESLTALAATLEHRVEERTSQLMVAEEALRQSQKMEAVGQLTGGIAHDFNNLLAGISGSLDMIAKRWAEGRTTGVERYLAAAQDASRRAAALTQRLLAFSRRQTLDPKPVDVNKLIAGMEDLVRRSVGPDVELEVVQAGGLWPTKIDGAQLENALLNLCINARDAMAPSGGRLTIETANKWLDDRAARERDLTPGQYISLCVSDTGTGMSPDVIERAFDPFFTTKPLGQGTGLGLSMVYGFVRQSGGQIRIYSEVGVGTNMCLYLPRYFGEVEQGDHQSNARAAELGEGEIILVVDDEPILRMLMLDVLQESGYRALEAADGPSALKILDSDTRIDLLISDVGLPGGMNGRQVADAARRKRHDLKVLFITGFAENAVVGNGHLAPGMHVVTKPFEIEALGQKVRDILDR
jgi:PAS domain S-box-containing protein